MPASRSARIMALPFLLALALGAGAAEAASFNCAKASAPDEYAICANPSLSNMDVEMATLFRVRMQIPMLMGAKGAAQDEQRAWLARRTACGASVACLGAAYQARIDQLNGTISGAMQDYCVKLGICG
jgi:uncharacterized protein